MDDWRERLWILIDRYTRAFNNVYADTGMPKKEINAILDTLTPSPGAGWVEACVKEIEALADPAHGCGGDNCRGCTAARAAAILRKHASSAAGAGTVTPPEARERAVLTCQWVYPGDTCGRVLVDGVCPSGHHTPQDHTPERTETARRVVPPGGKDAVTELAERLHCAWLRYCKNYGEPPHGTVPQLAALIELAGGLNVSAALASEAGWREAAVWERCVEEIEERANAIGLSRVALREVLDVVHKHAQANR